MSKLLACKQGKRYEVFFIIFAKDFFGVFIFLFSSNAAKISAKCELCQYRICQGEYSQRRTNCVKLNSMASFMTVNISRDCHVVLFLV